MNPAAPRDVTLQVNLCAGDLAYGEQVVSALVSTHRPDVTEVVAVADACRPQSTRDLHAASRFPEAAFSERIAGLRNLCSKLQAGKVVDRVVWLEPDPGRLRALNLRYAGVATPHSHDHLGHAFSAYFQGWECARTRYVAHFDADILLWQQPGFSWIRTATAAFAADERLIAASPRIAPPPDDASLVRVEQPGSGWLPSWPLTPVPGGWSSPWFSTRCHVMDRERLERVLPLRSRFRAQERDAMIDRMLAPAFHIRALSGSPRSRLAHRVAGKLPAFPVPPEVLLHEMAQERGIGCFYLADPRAWFIHPDTKPERFLKLLPQLLASVQRGEFPGTQRGVSGVQFSAWEALAKA